MGRLWCAGAHCAKSLIIPLIPTNRPPRASRLLSCHRAVGCKRPGLEHLFGGALANDIGFLRAWENLRWGQIFEHKARRAWWATHLDARRRSGVTRTEYCRLHRLTKSTFDRWLSALNLLESAREEARKRRKRTREPVSGNKRNKAVQAFWAMHVEALNWSGVSAKDHAAAHHISVYTLRTWRARLDADPLQVDWRARLHPSVRATISSGASSAANEQLVENSLTDAATAASACDGRSSRRSFTDAEKLAIVMEAGQLGVSAAAVCRRHNIATSMIFRWRVQFGGPPGRARGTGSGASLRWRAWRRAGHRR